MKVSSLLCSALLGHALLVICYASQELHDKWSVTQIPNVIASKAESLLLNTKYAHHEFNPETDPWVQQVGVKPRVFYFHNFLSDEERAHIIGLAAPKLKRSTVVGPNGESVVDPIRTSHGMFINRLQDDVIERIENRIAMVTMLPTIHQEDIQVLRYGFNQTYGAHYDSSDKLTDPGPHRRMATFLMYLADVEEGGETAFPHNSEWSDPTLPAKLGPFSKCAQGHVAAKPKKNDAVLFWSLKPDGTSDEAAMHTGCPVLKGTKWAAPVWIHDVAFRPETFVRPMASSEQDPGRCVDAHKQCPQWAAAGECKKNPGFMIGAGQPGNGACMHACGACTPCASDTDYDCINANRERAGYMRLDVEELAALGVHLQTHTPEL